MKRIALVTALLWAVATTHAPAWALPAPGETAPPLRVTQLDGSPWDLARARGKVAIVNFWATWCSTCREEMPALDAFYAQFHARDVELIGLSIDRPRDRPAVIRQASSIHYPCALLAEAARNGFGRPTVVPMTFIIARDGKIRAVLPPEKALTTADLAAAVEPLLQSPP
jgi:peroxiredoxin